jgi:hypothetical protein
MAYANAYERLYDVMKTSFTVIKNNNEYTLGEYMAQKAEKAIEKANQKENSVALAIRSALNPEIKEKKRSSQHQFPLKTLASACLSVMVVCSLLLSFGLFTKGSAESVPEIVESVDENEDVKTLKYDFQ